MVGKPEFPNRKVFVKEWKKDFTNPHFRCNIDKEERGNIMLKSRDSWKAKDAMKDMTWRQRLDYIWTYYNVQIIATVSIGALLIAFCSTVFAPRKQVVMSGITVNITLAEQGQKYLNEDLFAAFGGTDTSKQEAQFREATLGQTEYGDTTGAEIMSLVGDIAAGSLDYIIMDELSMTALSRGGWFGDITECLSEQQMKDFDEMLYKVQMADGSIVAVAVDITDTAFAKACAPKEKKVYLVLPGNTERAELSDEFFDWLLAWPGEG